MMNRSRITVTLAARSIVQLLAFLLTLQVGFGSSAFAESGSPGQAEVVIAQADDEYDASETAREHPIEPRYQPREVKEKSWFNNSYMFGMTRGLADSTIAPAGKAPLFLFTVPLDIAFLPFAFIGGLFG